MKMNFLTNLSNNSDFLKKSEISTEFEFKINNNFGQKNELTLKKIYDDKKEDEILNLKSLITEIEERNNKLQNENVLLTKKL